MNGQLGAYSKPFASASAQPTTNMQPGTTRKNGVQPITWARTSKGHNVTIRTALPKDAASLAAIGATSFGAAHGAALPPEHLQAYLASAWSEEHVAELIATPEIQNFVAEIGQTIVGQVSLNPLYLPDYMRHSAPVEVSRFFLHPDWIGAGVGSVLMSHLLHQAARTGYRTSWLRVWQGNTTAIQFYRRWGFDILTSETYPIRDTTLPAWVMVRSLDISHAASQDASVWRREQGIHRS